MFEERPELERVRLTVAVVASYLSGNTVESADIATLIVSVHRALHGVEAAPQRSPAERLVRPMAIRKTITPAYIISLENGRHYRMLRKHLAHIGMTPDAYRAKWNLPLDYPMVAPDLAKHRSELARAGGLGHHPDKNRWPKRPAET